MKCGGSVKSYLQTSDKLANWFKRHLSATGEITASDAPDDIAVYYKLPTMLLMAGRTKEAHTVLDYIQERFMLPNGDFRVSDDEKTKSAALNLYYGYMNGWVAVAAQRMGRFDISNKAYKFLQRFIHPELGGAVAAGEYKPGETNEVDIFMTSHIGLANLYFGDVKKAIKAGDLVTMFVKKERKQDQFYLRMDDNWKLVTDFPDDLKPFYVVKIKEPGQLYFFLGYPVAFLAKLYQATGDATYLDTAEDILDYLMTSHEAIYESGFAHKVAWAASIVSRITNKSKYADLSGKIADFLVTLQDDSGIFLLDQPPLDRYDQSAELGLWLREIHTELR